VSKLEELAKKKELELERKEFINALEQFRSSK
jgi:hypothetical protein